MTGGWGIAGSGIFLANWLAMTAAGRTEDCCAEILLMNVVAWRAFSITFCISARDDRSSETCVSLIFPPLSCIAWRASSSLLKNSVRRGKKERNELSKHGRDAETTLDVSSALHNGRKTINNASISGKAGFGNKWKALRTNTAMGLVGSAAQRAQHMRKSSFQLEDERAENSIRIKCWKSALSFCLCNASSTLNYCRFPVFRVEQKIGSRAG